MCRLIRGDWRDALTDAEKVYLRDRLAEAASKAGIIVPQEPTADSPGELAIRLEPRTQVQRPHLIAIDNHLKPMLHTPDDRVMITTPPQVGKSWRASRWFPFWWLTHRPADRIALGAYGLRLARSHALATRRYVENYGKQFGLVLDPQETAGADWSLMSGGGMRARGVGGGIVGYPANLWLVDDPIKDRQAADSPVVRAAVEEWWSGSVITRIAPGGSIVVTTTRWHPKDLCGTLLEKEGRIEDGGRWRVLHMPAIAQPVDVKRGFRADPLGRLPGEPLTHPMIASNDTTALLAFWASKRAETTIRDWDAQYQGSPFKSEAVLLTEQVIRDRTGIAPAQALQRRSGVGIDPSGGGRDTAGVVGGCVGADGKLWWTDDETAVMSSALWPKVACRLAYRIDADVFVIETNYGGDQATTLLSQAWEALQRDDEIPVEQIMPRIRAVHSRKSKLLRAEPIAQAVLLARAWFGDGLADLKSEWTLWEPGSLWSPGRLDAAVHLAYELLPPVPQGSKVVSVAGRTLGQAKSGAVATRTITRGNS